jgi:TolA-binding protein
MNFCVSSSHSVANYFRPLVIGLSTVILSACGSSQLQQDFRRLEQSVSDLRRFQAEQTTRISTLETQVRQTVGRVDELEYSQNKRLGSDLSSLKQDVLSLRRRVPPPAIVPQVQLETDEAAAASFPAALSESFSTGLQRIREGNFEASRAAFTELADLSAGTDYAAAMYFWLGITGEGLNDTRLALESYHTLVNQYPANPRVPSALLRQASVLIRVRDSKSAKLVLNKLIAQFPKSSEASTAKQKLKDL